MSLEKSIENGREHRKMYRGSKSFDSSCRNHGDCPICSGNRQHKNRKRQAIAEDLFIEEKQDYEMAKHYCVYKDGRCVSDYRELESALLHANAIGGEIGTTDEEDNKEEKQN